MQGVWFRGWTRQNAAGLKLNGWVRNRRDGTVEAVFSGPAGAVDDMVRRCHMGPPASDVAQVEARNTDEAPHDIGFHIRMSY